MFSKGPVMVELPSGFKIEKVLLDKLKLQAGIIKQHKSEVFEDLVKQCQDPTFEMPESSRAIALSIGLCMSVLNQEATKEVILSMAEVHMPEMGSSSFGR